MEKKFYDITWYIDGEKHGCIAELSVAEVNEIQAAGSGVSMLLPDHTGRIFIFKPEALAKCIFCLKPMEKSHVR